MSRKRSCKQVIEAIRGTGGVKIAIGQNLHVHRHTVEDYLKIYPTARKAYEDEVNKTGDFAESNIFKAILTGDLETSKWYAINKLQDRGFARRVETTGRDGGPINVSNSVKVVDVERFKRVLLAYHEDVEEPEEDLGEIGVSKPTD